MTHTNLGRCITVKNNYRKIIVIVEITGSGKIDSLGRIESIYFENQLELKINYRYRIVSQKPFMTMNRPRLTHTHLS